MRGVPKDDRAARVRAARAFAAIDAPTLAGALGVSKETLSRLENGRRDISTDELEVVAQHTGVPLAFLRDGFANGRDELRERLETLEAQQAEDSVRLAQLEGAVRTLAARGRQPRAGEGNG